ncbi:Rho guanine nucleotide exchange factor 28 [Larimichthys crocea]|uniref:Uncharacterized protein n=1 Tax=Larimichthys crocea TaxID=215358 RepID=A0ACD3QLN8_LARCR|nr:Rho guanine nucleotide exchange factor 28 [Larimichthys crocea]
MANMDYPQQWKNTEGQPREASDLQPKETLLHLAVRLGLVHLSRFLIHQPRGQRALTLPNQEGDTPLQLAQRDGQHAMFRTLAAPAVGPVPGVRCVWSDSSCMLRFCPGMDSLTLTMWQTPGSCPEDGIVILRDRLGDHSILKLINVLKANSETDKRGEDEFVPSGEGISKELQVEDQALVDNVFEEQLVLSLDDDDDGEEYPSLLSVNGHPMQSSGVQSQFTQSATDPLLSMTNSSDQTITQQTQGEDTDIQYHIGGVTRDSTGTDRTGLTRGFDCVHIPYSSPKISLRPARFARDNSTSDINPDAVLHSVNHSRSLLQALSLSKSLSLLHPGKQRTSSISEQSHEKRIEEEELDKYNIPTKVESEKYKVIRTFSFLKSRMSSTRNKTKVNHLQSTPLLIHRNPI